jgi:plasmid stabilization system protein ParE
VAELRYTARALDDLCFSAFLAADDPSVASKTVDLILQALAILKAHPLIGRRVEEGRRELAISRGRSGYVALYRFLPGPDRVHILAIRHQREAGFEEYL